VVVDFLSWNHRSRSCLTSICTTEPHLALTRLKRSKVGALQAALGIHRCDELGDRSCPKVSNKITKRDAA
jgi:hypothetical protein